MKKSTIILSSLLAVMGTCNSGNKDIEPNKSPVAVAYGIQKQNIDYDCLNIQPERYFSQSIKNYFLKPSAVYEKNI